MLIVVNTDETEKVKSIYKSNLFIRLIQISREKAGLNPWNKIEVYYLVDQDYVTINKEHIENTIGYNILPYDNQEYKYIIKLNSKELKGNNHKYIGLDEINATVMIRQI